MRVIAVIFAAAMVMSCAQGKWNAASSTYSLSFTSPLSGNAQQRTDKSLTVPSTLR